MEGKVRSIAKGGDGIVNAEGLPVFIPGVLPGEVIEFTILSQTKQIARGRLDRLISPSPFRIAPPCPHIPLCGGCNFQHVVYSQQVNFKLEIFQVNLKKLGRILHPPEIEVIESPPYRYRSRIEIQIQNGRIGFFQRQSHDIVAIESCHVMPAEMERFIDRIRPLCRPYNEGQIMILTNGSDLAAMLITPEKKLYLTEAHDIIFEFDPYRFRVRPENFLQANLYLLPTMLRILENELHGKRYAQAADLFCGIGYFTLPLGFHCHDVFALENDESNLRALKINLSLNQRKSVHIQAVDVGRASLPQVQLIVADPPRSGLGEGLIEKIATVSPEKLIYFSCDSATFARDAWLLYRRGFALKTVKLIDIFPQTDHFEIFSAWTRE